MGRTSQSEMFGYGEKGSAVGDHFCDGIVEICQRAKEEGIRYARAYLAGENPLPSLLQR